jgi:NADPH-dependent 2,4-dienoyl-CoA reductase/sulfur reductase-like enzyme
MIARSSGDARGLHHVIIGSGVAALSAAEAIRLLDPDAQITICSDEAAPFYSRPGLAYLLTGDVPAAQLTLRTAQELTALRAERITASVASIDAPRHVLTLHDGHHLRYDRLLLATGAASVPPAFPGGALDGVVQLDSLADTQALIERASTARQAVVIGGGSTALEFVDGLNARGVHTTYLMRGERYWSKVFDRVESAIVESQLLAEGVTLFRNTIVQEALGASGRLVAVRTTDGRVLACDLLAVSIGVRPRVALARAAGIAVDRGILATEFLETNVEDVFAAGDCAQVYDPVTRSARLDTLWSSAAQQGTTAGYNMAGMRVPMRLHTPINITRVAGITVSIIGAVGSAEDPDLLTLTRGQSERWTHDPHAWSVGGARRQNRLRVVISGTAIIGAVVMGDQRVSHALAHLIGEEVDISALRPALDAEPDAALDLLLAFCETHVRDHDGHRHASAHR